MSGAGGGVGTSGAGETEPDAQAVDARPSPLSDHGRAARFTMVAMLSLEDDITVVSSLNEHLAPVGRLPAAELGHRDASGQQTPVPLGEEGE